MKMRPYIGKEVRLTWRGDPIKDRIERSKRPLGRASLAVWIERGLVEQVIDGVVHILHSEGYSPGQSEWNEAEETRVPEDLIETVVVLYPQEENLNKPVEPPKKVEGTE